MLVFTSAIVFNFWYRSRVHERQMMNLYIESSLKQSAIRLEDAIRLRLYALESLAKHLQYHSGRGELTKQLFIPIVMPVYERFGGFRALNFIDRDGYIRWVYPLKGNEGALNKNVLKHKEPSVRLSFARARDTGKPAMTSVIELFQGGLGVATYYPLIVNGRPAGYLNGVFTVGPLIKSTVTMDDRVGLMVLNRDRVLYSTGNPLEGFQEEGIKVRELSLRLRMWPMEGLVGIFKKHRWITLVILLFISLSLSYAVYELQRRYSRVKELDSVIKESEYKFRSLVENSVAGVYLIQDGLFRYVNPRFCEITGYSREELLDRLGPRDLTYESDWPLVERKIRERIDGKINAVNYTFRAVKADGTVFDVEVYGARTLYNGRPAIIGTLLDITEKKSLQEQLIKSQRLESVGLLAGGIAHDFNNILTAIIGYATMLKMKLGESEHVDKVDAILKASDRASNLTKGLLAFSRRQILQPRTVMLSHIIRDFEKIIKRLIPEHIEIECFYNDTKPVYVDPAQIEQVLMNLLTNARDALPGGGKIIIETFDALFDEDYLMSHRWVTREGEYVCLSVSDNGIGMDEETQKHIFEPFFTTKEVGKGTGLGLATVYGIVKQHRGYINLYSEPGRGTTFKLYFPVAEDFAEETGKDEEVSTEETGGGESVLVAEDEADVRDTICTALEERGYRVCATSDGKEALEKIMENPAAFDLLILDVVMPGYSGKEVFDRARKVGFKGKVLYISGYTMNYIHKDHIVDEKTAFLSKPFTPHELLKEVRNVLERKQ